MAIVLNVKLNIKLSFKLFLSQKPDFQMLIVRFSEFHLRTEFIYKQANLYRFGSFQIHYFEYVKFKNYIL